MAVYNVGLSLLRAGIDVTIAWTGPLHDLTSNAIPLDELDPADYTTFVWVCGPLHPALREIVRRFDFVRRVAVGVSLVEGTDAHEWFDDLLVRDSPGRTTFDLAMADIGWPHRPSPGAARDDTVSVCFVGEQTEYGDRARVAEVERLTREALAQAGISHPGHVETRLGVEPKLAFEAEAAIQRSSALISTRLHGTLLALYHSVPVLAIDQISRGAKVSRVVGRTGWPLLVTVDELDSHVLHRAIGRLRDGSLQQDLQAARERMIALSRRAVEEATALILGPR
jgi:hypothetical protein